MKHIKKRGCPRDYAKYCREVKGTNMDDYRELVAPIKNPLLEALISEQGGLCAYTMMRIDPDSAHIEHLKPATLCRKESTGSDLQYENLVACFPRSGMDNKYRYGAHKKDNWWDATMFVSPLDHSCERRFRFKLDGTIEQIGAAAVKTVEVLALDHPSLSEDRSRAMREFIYGTTGLEAPSAAHTTRAVENICKPDQEGMFHEFCVAIRDGLREHLKYLDKLRKKKQAIRGTRKNGKL